MISVIITTYNNAMYIEQALESLIGQSYQDFEIIVVDDGSNDGTKTILKPYMEKIRYIYKRNGGEASARNVGLALVQGEYVAFLDADDLYRQDKLEKQMRVFLTYPDVDVVYNDIEVVDKNLQYISTLRSEEVCEVQENFLCMMLVRQIIPGTASMMIRRRCIEGGLRYPEHYKNAVDYDFTINLASNYRFKYLEEPLYLYRRHSENLTNNHVKQLESEEAIIRSLGLEKIRNIVSSSSFEPKDKEFILAKIWIKIQEWEMAKEILVHLVNNYKNPYAWFYLGNCYHKGSDFEKAVLAYEKAINEDKDMAEAFNNLGCMYALLNNVDKAKKFVKQSLRIRSEYMDAKYNLEQLTSNNSSYKITKCELRKILTIY